MIKKHSRKDQTFFSTQQPRN